MSAKDDLYEYLIYYPEGYTEKKKEDFPLMIFLHGAGERGTDISKVKIHGPPMKIEAGETYPAIVVAPQCPEDIRWDTDRLEELLQDIIKTNRVDESRIYLTGLSMGGYGTWAWSIENPEHFAAIAPICGGGEIENISRIKDIPTWVFHGAQDNVVPLEKSQEMVDALIAVGGKPNFTIYPEADHDSWTITYNNPKFYEWMFNQKRQ
ncbi:dienelactone hydrolase family protein [Saprospiraceae bacterium]|nr:dienelactone hydrolase family protein [Saprospiraceae bacterium]